MNRNHPYPCVLLLSLVVVAGCGESGSPTDEQPPTDSTPAEASLVALVQSSCTPLEGASARLFMGDDSTATDSATTDDAGAATFTGLAEGIYAIQVDAPSGHELVALEEARKSTFVPGTGTDTLVFRLVADPPPPVTDHEGTRYQTVRIGDRVWMAENLRVTTFANGDAIPRRRTDGEWEQAANEELPGWSYYGNDAELGEVYGPLYNNHVAVDPRGVCPAGWRIPVEADWQQLEIELGIGEIHFDRIGTAGADVGAGSNLKSARTEPAPHPRWASPNGDALNCTGFSGVAEGYRVGHPKTSDQVTGQFRQLDREAAWWSATASGDGHFGRGLIWGNAGIYRNDADGFGFGIRCAREP